MTTAPYQLELAPSRDAVGIGSDALVLPPVLDACCGSRMMWMDKKDPRAIYTDRRDESYEIAPDRAYPSGTVIHVRSDVVADFTALPFADESFWHVVFDPPHIIRNAELGTVTKKYGVLNGDWKAMLAGGFRECFRVLKPNGTLIFKWCETQIPLKEILALTPEKPLYGHKGGQKSVTHWMAFLKQNNGPCTLIRTRRQRDFARKLERERDEQSRARRMAVGETMAATDLLATAQQTIHQLKAALAGIMPFVLEDYYPNCAIPAFKAAVEAAQACLPKPPAPAYTLDVLREFRRLWGAGDNSVRARMEICAFVEKHGKAKCHEMLGAIKDED